MKYTEVTTSCFSERNFQGALLFEKETVNKHTEVITSCFSREEFLKDLFFKKGTEK